MIPVRFDFGLVTVFFRFLDLAPIREQGADVALGIGHVNFRALLDDVQLIWSFDDVPQPCPLIFRTRALTAAHSSARTARPAPATASDAGDTHPHSSSAHASVASHRAVLIAILHRGTQFL